jgi:hypothetical protein
MMDGKNGFDAGTPPIEATISRHSINVKSIRKALARVQRGANKRGATAEALRVKQLQQDPAGHKKRARISQALASSTFTQLMVETSLCYNVLEYPFGELLKQLVWGRDDGTLITEYQLDQWHQTLPGFAPDKSTRLAKKALGDKIKPPSDRRSARHEEFQACYEKFLKNVIVPHMMMAMDAAEEEEEEEEGGVVRTWGGRNNDSNKPSSFVVQSIPCVRFQPPSTDRMTTPHVDATYGHQPGQVNFWVPLTTAYDSNSVYAESEPGKEDYHPFGERGAPMRPGEVKRFYGNRCVHFTEANRTGVTRVSFDFRVVPGFVFDPDHPKGRYGV